MDTAITESFYVEDGTDQSITTDLPNVVSDNIGVINETIDSVTSSLCNVSNLCESPNVAGIEENWATRAVRLENLICPPLVMSIGIVGNILSFLVMRRKEMRKTSIGIYLMVLSVSDSLVCNSFYPNLIGVAVDGRNVLTGIANNFSLFLSYVGGHTSAWLIVALTIDRFITVTFPFKAKSICTPIKAKKIVSGVVIFFVLFDGINWLGLFSHEILTPDTQMYIGRTDGMTAYINYIWHLLDAIMMNLIPSPIIITLNSIIILKLRRMRIQRREMTRHSQQNQNETADKKLYVMLISVSMVYATITIPYYFWTIYTGYLQHWKSIDQDEAARRSLVLFSFIHVYCMNHSINFYIYCLTGEKFRSELILLFKEPFTKCCRSRAIREHDSSAPVSGVPTGVSMVSLPFSDVDFSNQQNANRMP